MPPDKGVLQRVRKGMAAVQSAGDVRWRKGNNKGPRRVGATLRLEESALLPPGVPRRLDGLGVVGLEVGGIERLKDLLLARLGRILVLWECLDDLLGLLLGLRLARVLLRQFGLLRGKLGGFFGARLLICLWYRKSARSTKDGGVKYPFCWALPRWALPRSFLDVWRGSDWEGTGRRQQLDGRATEICGRRDSAEETFAFPAALRFDSFGAGQILCWIGHVTPPSLLAMA